MLINNDIFIRIKRNYLDKYFMVCSSMNNKNVRLIKDNYIDIFTNYLINSILFMKLCFVSQYNMINRTLIIYNNAAMSPSTCMI